MIWCDSVADLSDGAESVARQSSKLKYLKGSVAKCGQPGFIIIYLPSPQEWWVGEGPYMHTAIVYARLAVHAMLTVPYSAVH